MRLFLKNTILFILPLIILFVGGLFLTNKIISKGDLYKVPKDRTTLILGHSHSACAFNDSLLEGFYNLAQTTEGYPYTYFKAKKILEQNNHIKTIFLEYTNNQIAPWAYNRIYGKYLGVNMARMFPVLGKRFVLMNLKNTKSPVRILETMKKSLSQNIDFLWSRSENYLEENWHNHITPDHIYDGDIPLETLSVNVSDFKDVYSVQEENLRYLVMINELCKQYKVELVLIRSPVLFDDNYRNELVFQGIRKAYFSDVPFLDFVNYPLNESCFSDLNHLNSKGRDKFTNEFKMKIVDSGLLSSPNLESKVLEMSN